MDDVSFNDSKIFCVQFTGCILLPLFAEKMTEPETELLIEEHMSECPKCREKYTGIETEATTAVDTAEPLRSLKKEIHRRRRFSALIAGLLVFTLAVICMYHTISMKPIQWEDGLIAVKGIETVTPNDRLGCHYYHIRGQERIPPQEYSGPALILDMDSRIALLETEAAEEDGIVTAIIQGVGVSSVFNQEVPQPAEEIVIYPVPDRLIYGYDDSQMILWGEELNGGVQVLPRLALTYYLILSVFAAALSGVLWFLCRNKQRSWIIRQVFIAPLSYIMAHLSIIGTRQPASLSRVISALSC